MGVAPIIIFIIGITLIPIECLFCDDYIVCMEQLEIKQHECLRLEQNLRLKRSTECQKKRWDQKLALNSLHMRRAEIAKDCARKYQKDALIAESTLDEETRNQCDSYHKKFRFASLQTPLRRKRSVPKGKRSLKRSSLTSKAQECRDSARNWHKHCSALAKCCPLTEECKQSTHEIMQQIFEGRQKLHQLSRQCSSERSS